jgi:signal transduction histidine kinase
MKIGFFPGGFTLIREFWLILVLLTMAVTAPTLCLLWFMTKAVTNERLAVRQKLSQYYQSQLSVIEPDIGDYWNKKRALLSLATDALSPGDRFVELMENGEIDSAIVFGPDGRLMYPILAKKPFTNLKETAEWKEALNLEFGRNAPLQAAASYAGIAQRANDDDDIARALSGQIRCLLKANRKQEALRIISGELTKKRYRQSTDGYGRLIVPNAQLMALDLIEDRDSVEYKNMLGRLIVWIRNYSEPILPSSQRLFLMERLMKLDDTLVFPTFKGEIHLNEGMDFDRLFFRSSVLSPVVPGKLYGLSSHDVMVTGLYTHDRIEKEIQSLVDSRISFPAVMVQVSLKTAAEERKSFLKLDLGQEMPDWEVRLFYKGDDPLAVSSERRIAVYFWTAVLVIGGIVLLELLIAYMLFRQVKLNRLKNDFVATVSHELKTPLASIRLFIDTLLEGRSHGEKQTREYLELISKENVRLTHLIDNFLTFSRMERKKYAFQFEEIDAGEIINKVVENVRERYETDSCLLSVEAAEDLPPIMADKDAMITVILNMLDNAVKYSRVRKRIFLRLFVDGSHIAFQVEDNGIGISRRDINKIFHRFYRVDRRLSRHTEGCGLGLSIVDFIVKAHNGSVDAKSELGKGSVFTVRLPI